MLSPTIESISTGCCPWSRFRSIGNPTTAPTTNSLTLFEPSEIILSASRQACPLGWRDRHPRIDPDRTAGEARRAGSRGDQRMHHSGKPLWRPTELLSSEGKPQSYRSWTITSKDMKRLRAKRDQKRAYHGVAPRGIEGAPILRHQGRRGHPRRTSSRGRPDTSTNHRTRRRTPSTPAPSY